jgi:membrane-bound ClpP family serine protease
MDFAILLFMTLVGILLILISLAEKSIIYGIVGSIILFIGAMIIFNSGFEVQSGVSSVQTFNNLTISGTLNGTVSTNNLITTKYVKDSNTQYFSMALFLLSIIMGYFLVNDYRNRGK